MIVPEVIVALDFPREEEALALVDLLGEGADFYKVGLELFARGGPSVLEALGERGKRIFLDLKLHDIPNTVRGAVEAASQHGVDLLTVHVAGGTEMMEAAAEAGEGRVRLMGVTLLTSFGVSDVEQTWGRSLHSIREEVIRLATLGRDAGMDGVVASPLEAEPLRRQLGPEFLIVTPGIRLAGGKPHDQARVATPEEAVRAGSDYLVVGRTVTAADDPAAALEAVMAATEAGIDSRVPSETR